MATNSPSRICRLMSRRISARPPLAPYPLLTFFSSRKCMLGRFKSAFQKTHELVQNEANDPDGQDAEDDVLVDERVVFLPEEAADARRTSQHFCRHNHQPGNAETQAKTGEHVGQRCRD